MEWITDPPMWLRLSLAFAFLCWLAYLLWQLKRSRDALNESARELERQTERLK